MNVNILQVIFLALLQGVTELFPISSLGHTIFLPPLLGLGNIDAGTSCGGKSCFLPLIVALHLGTSIALLLYFWRDWLQVGKTLLTIAQTRKLTPGTDEWVSWLILVGCVPAGIFGVLFQNKIKDLFESPILAAAFLIVNGSVLFLGEGMRRRAEAKLGALSPREREAQFRPLKTLSWKEAIVVGFAQSLALIPGFSRSGVTMVAGLGVRLTHEDAARFSFLLGTPLILGAALLEVPLLLKQHLMTLLLILFGMVLSGVAAYFSTKFLTKYFETGRLNPFAYYCWGAGLLLVILYLTVFHAAA
ncbi:undecaprenyl-diphosphate phosphatase [Ktedonosporobacter rubrisoli]|uniref:Undecaprenyl-diphosphatase n=1 Tax=Ktedonosporobacter rubrisoli TaxID=2509675 RepID=A0A4P6JY45_KTERU|nr:undecaprenyl-diphosphate phosphatase [Ktedonosporobacter rubrisoli]QBD79946.1 undecaprenyl-diphosphate phosphatase [Ktedonosporobacter rubrisoli]